MQILLKNKAVDLFRSERAASDTSLVLLVTGGENSKEVWEKIKRLTRRDFCLASYPVTDWENDLSPWKAEKVFRGGKGFGGGADKTIRELERVIVPGLKRMISCP